MSNNTGFKPLQGVEAEPAADTPTRLVRFLECARRACGHILIEDERIWVSDPEWVGRKMACCPECGADSFYTLNESGRRTTTRDHEKYREGIDPSTLEPLPSTGVKRRIRLLEARRKALIRFHGSASGTDPAQSGFYLPAHSPEPWDSDEKEHVMPYLPIVIRSGHHQICRIFIDDAPVPDYNAEQHANARLIRSSPRLLDALRVIAEWTGGDSPSEFEKVKKFAGDTLAQLFGRREGGKR